MNDNTTVRIEVFRPGTFTPMEGRSITYSAADLRAAADAYDKETAPAPVVVGHPAIDAPAYAWAEGFEFDATSQRLYADVGQINPAFADAVRKGSYKKVSLSFHRPDSPANPTPGTWYPKHIGFLGGAAPGVTGLRNIQFSTEGDDVTFVADFAGLPPPPRVRVAVAATPAAPANVDPAFAAREAELAQREAEFAARESEWKERATNLLNKENADFAEGLIAEGKLLPVHKNRIISILGAATESQTVSFADGEQPVPMLQALKDIFSEMPKVVSFGAFDIGPDLDEDRPPSVVVPNGYSVDPRQNELYQRARQLEREKGVSFAEAVDMARGK